MLQIIHNAFPVLQINRCTATENARIFHITDSDDGRIVIHHGDKAPIFPRVTVTNNHGLDAHVMAIDNCMFFDGDTFKKCDCALSFSTDIYFIEIKKAKKGTGKEKRKIAAAQLESTITKFREKVDFSGYKVHALLCVGFTQVSPAASAKNLAMKVKFSRSPLFANLIEGNELVL